MTEVLHQSCLMISYGYFENLACIELESINGRKLS